ncbi:MAG: transcription termination/antitermination protein NusG [Fusobacteriota bacterium]
MSQKEFEKKWYAIHAYSGHENKVKLKLEKRIQNLNLEHKVFRIAVPEEEKTEFKDGKAKQITNTLFPGYVLIEIEVEKETGEKGIGYKVDSEVWYVIRNTPGVTGFVGIGSTPSPLDKEDVTRLLGKMGVEAKSEIPKVDLDIEVGDVCEIKEGAFKGSTGEVSSIDFEHRKLKVMVDLFGRMTPVEIDFNGVEKK